VEEVLLFYKSVSIIIIITSGQSNLTGGCIAVAHGQFSHIPQVASMHTPYIVSQRNGCHGNVP